MMTEGWRNGQQVQPRSPDNLAEVSWTDVIVEVPDDDPPPLGSTAFCNVLALR